MLDFDLAQARLALAGKAPQQIQTCALEHLSGRVLAQALSATLDSPPADNSAMDGYAIRHADYRAGHPLPVQQRCYAGELPEPQQPGCATRLFTGSLIPAGADTVVMQEDCQAVGDTVQILQEPQPGQHVRRQGEDTARGAPLLAAGTLLGPAHIALLASQGIAQAPVFAPLRVGILTTGDELVAPGAPRAAQQLYNSNGPMLAALVAGMGAQVSQVLHARDEADSLRAAFEALLADSDLIVSIGGVSVGERDLVKPVLESLAASSRSGK